MANKSLTESKERQKKDIEKKPQKKEELTFEELKKKKEELQASEQLEVMDAICSVRGDVSLSKQENGLWHFNKAITSVLEKLARAGANISGIKKTSDLEREINIAKKAGKIELDKPEETAVQNIDRIICEPKPDYPGPTAKEIKDSWGERIEVAQEASKGWTSKYMDYWKSNPGGTAAATAAAIGVAGTVGYLGYVGIKSLFGIGASEKGKNTWFKTIFLAPVAATLIGGYFGKEVGKKVVGQMFADAGLDIFDVNKKAREGKLTKTDKKRLDKVGKKMGEIVEEKQREAEEKASAAAPEVPEHEDPEVLESKAEVETRELREFGEKLLDVEGAEELADKTHLIMTGKSKTYFRFNKEKSKWQWASATQKKESKWVDTGKDKYKDTKFKEVNDISDSLARGTDVVEGKGLEVAGKNSEVTKRGAEALKIGRYPTAKKIFLGLYFNPRYTDPAIYDQTIDNISHVKLKKIRGLVDKHKGSRKIPKSALPSIKSGITEEKLFKMLEHMLKFSKFGHVTEDMTVWAMFEAVANNPFTDQLGSMNQRIMEALKDGDFEDALKSLAFKSAEIISKQAKEMVERLDNVLGIDVNKLSKDEKEVYRQIQVLLMTNPTFTKLEPKDAIDNVLKTNKKFKEYPKAVELALKFFAEVKKRTPAILERVVKKFEIKKEGLPINYLRAGVNMDNLRFFNACELVLLDKAIESEGDQATDLVILGVLMRSFTKPYLKGPYIGLIGDELTKDVPSISIPGLKALKPYFEKAARVAGSYFGYKALDFFQELSPLVTQHPTKKSHEEMAEAFKGRSIETIVFAPTKEAVGTGLELTTDALAAIVLAFPGVQDNLAACDTGKEFLDLIRVNGGRISAFKDRDGALGILIDTGYEIFLARPGAIVWESAKSFAEGELGDAAQIWIGGSSFFVGANAMRGFVQRAPAADGSGKTLYSLRSRALNAIRYGARALKYPIKAPRMALGAAVHTTKGLAMGKEAIGSMARAPLRSGKRSLNWTRDILKYRRLPGQNIENMVDTGRLLEKHFGAAKTASATVEKADIMARAKRAYRTAEDLVARPSETWKRLTAGDWHWGMAKKYAERLGKQHNDLFGFAESEGFKLNELVTHGKLQEVIRANERLTNFLEEVQKDPKVLEKIREASKELKPKELQSEIRTILKDMRVDEGLSKKEIEALAGRIKNEKTARQITGQIERAAARHTALEAIKPGMTAKLVDRLRGAAAKAAAAGPKAKAVLKGSTETQEVLKTAQKNLKNTQRQIATARDEIRTIDGLRARSRDLKKLKSLEKRLATARQMLADAKSAQSELKYHIHALRWVAEAEDGLSAAKLAKAGRAIANSKSELVAARRLAAETLENSGKAMESVGKMGKLGTIAKWGGRGLVVGGAVFSAVEMTLSAHEAITTDVKGRGTVKGLESALWGANAVADTAAAAVLFGAGGTGVTYVSAAALPLIPITYAGVTIAEAAYERTKTSYEWIQEGNPYQVLHNFYTTASSLSLGEAWMTGMHIDSPKEAMQEKKDTMRKIFRGLVAIQKDPGLLNFILDAKNHPPSDAKNKAIEARIKKNYTPYHAFYFKNMAPTGMHNYKTAQKFILDAQLFDTIMQRRDQYKKAGKEYVIRGKDSKFSLHLDRYDVKGGLKNPEGKVIYNPLHVVQAYKEELMREVVGIDDNKVLRTNLERMDDAYLVRLYVQTRLVLEDEKLKAQIDGDPEIKKALISQHIVLESYLKAGRDVNFVYASGDPKYRKPRMSIKEVLDHGASAGSVINKAYLDFEKKNYSMTPALHALYKLGQYFGYMGEPSEKELKLFFNERGQNYRGLYWDGEEWRLNERGAEFDDSFGPILTNRMMEKVIARMKEQPDNILKHRSDTIFWDAKDYTAEVKNMAKVLEGGLVAGAKREYQRSAVEVKQEIVAPPKLFDPKKIDYRQSKEALMGDYKEVMEYTKTQTAWTQLKYTVNDEKSITLSRGDGSASVELTRSGSHWNIGGYEGGFSLVQAVALGNLKNWAEQWLDKEDETGGSSRPFEIDGAMIDFDVSYNPIDTTFLKYWVDYYGKIGVSKNMAVNLLNNWYQKDKHKG